MSVFDVVVGTPRRLIDLINSNRLKLNEVHFLVLDEADQMLAVGFEEDVETILEKLPSERQSMLFSASMPAWVNKTGFWCQGVSPTRFGNMSRVLSIQTQYVTFGGLYACYQVADWFSD
ncbi:hypothetical protein Droror1_Dr00015105 [Drosera rotundifolia]